MTKRFLFLYFFVIFVFLGCSTNNPTIQGKEVIDTKKEYFTGGQISSEFLMTDKSGLNGRLKRYGYKGNVTSIVDVANGVKNGMEVLYDEKQRPIRHVPYINGRIHGTFTDFYPNGDTLATIPYINGVREGEAYSFRKDGTIARTVIFNKGKMIN
jgi:antitoxin component YwqK of YwqJK toxin-antitoxin module